MVEFGINQTPSKKSRSMEFPMLSFCPYWRSTVSGPSKGTNDWTWKWMIFGFSKHSRSSIAYQTVLPICKRFRNPISITLRGRIEQGNVFSNFCIVCMVFPNIWYSICEKNRKTKHAPMRGVFMIQGQCDWESVDSAIDAPILFLYPFMCSSPRSSLVMPIISIHW